MQTVTKVINGKEVKLSRVKKVESIGLRHTYDIEVQEDHNFYAGGINVHNCEYHGMLRHYETRYGQQLLKFNDTFVVYRPRSLMFYPAGPDKRVLRGRTRVFACIPGDTLISSDRGLIPMVHTSVGDRINIGSITAPVSCHKYMGKKQLWKLKLGTGQELRASKEHKVLTYRNNRATKVRLSDLKPSDVVLYGLGGEFPDGLAILKYVDVPEFVDERHRLVHSMLLLKKFTYTSLIEASQTTRIRGSVGVFVSKLVRYGLVTKEQNGLYKDGEDRYTYTVTSFLNEKDFLVGRNKGAYEYRHDIQYPTHMTEDLAYILGYLTGDGYVVRTVKFKTLNKQRTQHYINCVRRVFSTSPNIGTYLENIGQGEGRTEHTVRNFYANIELGCWVAYFRRIGLESSYSADKTIPHTILQAPRACVVAYLKALFECDAKVAHNRFTYRTISGKLARQVQQLLFRLGVNCKIHTNKSASSSSGFLYSVKLDPRFHGVFLDAFNGSLSISELALPIDTQERYFHLGETHYTNIRYSKIASIEETDAVVDVYDMTVDHKRHAYVADGVLVSNSIDEIGWFDNAADSKKVKTSAREVYTALDRSLLTVRGAADRLINSGFDNILTGYSMNVSSPASQRDKICELVRQSQDSESMYGIHRPTWEVNPTLPRLSKAIVSEYQKNPLDAERDYGANPPLSANPYITNRDWIDAAFTDKPNKIKMRDKVKNRKRQGSATKWAEVDKVGKSRKPTMLAIDAGYTNNSFACAVGRLDDDGAVVINLLFEIIPESGIPLNYNMINEEVLEDVLYAQNTQVVLADRWNSIKILQDIEANMDIVAEQYSLKYKDIGLTKSFLEAGMLRIPRMVDKKASIKDAMSFDAEAYPMCYKGYPVEHMVLQMLTVQDTGTQVNKGDGLTDDLWRATCLLVWGLTAEKYEEFMTIPDAPEEDERFRPQAFAVSKLGSGGGKSVGSGSSVSFNGDLGVMKRGR